MTSDNQEHVGYYDVLPDGSSVRILEFLLTSFWNISPHFVWLSTTHTIPSSFAGMVRKAHYTGIIILILSCLHKVIV